MSSFDVWVVIGALTVSTLLTRCTFSLFGHAIKLPAKMHYVLQYAPAAVLASIVAQDLAGVGGDVTFDPLDPKLLAAAGGTVFFLFTRHMLGTVIVGMGLFTVLRLVL